jgi:hypothetical protein
MKRLARVPAVLVLSSAVGIAAAAPAAAISHRPGSTITGGTSKLTISKSTLRALHHHHFTLTAKSPATLSGRTLTTPIKSGTFTGFSATVQTAGGFTISKGSKHITVSNLHSDSSTGVGTARVTGHGRVKAVTNTQPTHTSFGNPITASGFTVSLAKPLIKILDAKFNTLAFNKHKTLGTGSVSFTYSN